MQIFEYDDVDPMGVLQLNLLCLGYALTPERVALIRQLDARPFPYLAIYAVEDGIVIGQVGVFRLLMASVDGPEDVGAVWAVCTHPAFSRRGIANQLLEEAHARMRAAGLRFSTLGTTRYRTAHRLYREMGYEDVFLFGSTLARRAQVADGNRLRAEQAGAERLPLAAEVFARVSAGRLGFARRPVSFLSTMIKTGDLGADDVWLLWEGDALAGCAVATVMDSVLRISDLLLISRDASAEAVAALARARPANYVQVRVSGECEAKSLIAAGYPPPREDWGTFMLKPLTREATTADARRLFGIGTDRFLISWLDET